MGYNIVTNLVYGIQLSEEIAKEISKRFTTEDAELNIPNAPCFYRKLDTYFTSNGRNRPQETPIVHYAEYEDGIGRVLYPVMLSDDTDGRIHAMDYEPGYNSVIGIHISSKSCGEDKEFKHFKKNIPLEAEAIFKAHIMPILLELGMKEEDINPDLEMVNQVL